MKLLSKVPIAPTSHRESTARSHKRMNCRSSYQNSTWCAWEVKALRFLELGEAGMPQEN